MPSGRLLLLGHPSGNQYTSRNNITNLRLTVSLTTRSIFPSSHANPYQSNTPTSLIHSTSSHLPSSSGLSFATASQNTFLMPILPSKYFHTCSSLPTPTILPSKCSTPYTHVPNGNHSASAQSTNPVTAHDSESTSTLLGIKSPWFSTTGKSCMASSLESVSFALTLRSSSGRCASRVRSLGMRTRPTGPVQCCSIQWVSVGLSARVCLEGGERLVRGWQGREMG